MQKKTPSSNEEVITVLHSQHSTPSTHLRSGLHARFCRCIKAVRSQKPGKTRKQKNAAEKSAIAICVSSVIQRLPRRTLHSFRCKNTKEQHAFIRTQKKL